MVSVVGGLSAEIVKKTEAVVAAGISRQSMAACPISRKKLFMGHAVNLCCSLNRWFGECVCLHLCCEMKADLNRDQVDRRRGKYVEFHPSFFPESTISTAVVLRNPPMG